MLRRYFVFRRELLAELARAAYETVYELMSQAVEDTTRGPAWSSPYIWIGKHVIHPASSASRRPTPRIWSDDAIRDVHRWTGTILELTSEAQL